MDDFEKEMVEAMPKLRSFCIKLVGLEKADDLVQDTLYRALKCKHQFHMGTIMVAWLFVIARNSVHSERRRSWRIIQWDDELAKTLKISASALHALELKEVLEAMRFIRPEESEAIMMIAEGLSYEEAAAELGILPGTVKSRVSRGRADMERLFDA